MSEFDNTADPLRPTEAAHIHALSETSEGQNGELECVRSTNVHLYDEILAIYAVPGVPQRISLWRGGDVYKGGEWRR
jgi:hypothetical protein